jgi:hypothetical protein
VAERENKLKEREEQQRAEVLALPVLSLRQHGRLTAADDGDALLSVSVGPAGEAVALWSAPADREALKSTTVQPGWASFPDARAIRPAGARITVHPHGLADSVRIAEMPLAHATAQPLPNDRFLVVAARCRWRPEGPDRNALVYGLDGALVAEYTFGDGINKVLTTPSGDAWVGYFDEGVYGNYGWGGPGPEPLGSCGLARFGQSGERNWRFPSDAAAPIDDCYALNVTGETAWACYYSDFPVVRVGDGEVTVWRNQLARGAGSIIVDDRRVGLVGSYPPGRDCLAIGEFDEADLREVGRYRLVLPDGQALPDRVRKVGRGPDLHIFHGPDWYRLSLADISLA